MWYPKIRYARRLTLAGFIVVLTGALGACEESLEPAESSEDTEEAAPRYSEVRVSSGSRLGDGALSSNRYTMALPAEHRRVAFTILERMPGPWTLAADGSPTGTPQPEAIFRLDRCQSDYQVAAAVLYSWGAEVQARRGDATAIRECMRNARLALTNAWNLCDQRSMSRANCGTVSLINCHELRSFANS